MSFPTDVDPEEKTYSPSFYLTVMLHFLEPTATSAVTEHVVVHTHHQSVGCDLRGISYLKEEEGNNDVVSLRALRALVTRENAHCCRDMRYY